MSSKKKASSRKEFPCYVGIVECIVFMCCRVVKFCVIAFFMEIKLGELFVMLKVQ